MTRTGLDATAIADTLRNACGDGTVEWVHQPWQTGVLLDAADMLDENVRLREANAKLRELVRDI